jgi:acetyl-CoA carboxylase biotin carboxyl carrier protein
MKLSKIQELLRLVADSGVSEVEIEEDDFKLTIRQNSPQVVMQPAQQYPAQMTYGPPQQAAPQQPPPQQAPPQQAAAPQQAPAQQPASPPQGAPAASSASGGAASAPADGSASEAASAAEPADNGTAEADAEETAAEDYVVKAPIVGTFYEAPSPEDDPYVEVGDSVSEGDVLCIIEAMKLMNEIECETSGTIKEVLVEDAEPVEFDQPLFVIAED